MRDFKTTDNFQLENNCKILYLIQNKQILAKTINLKEIEFNNNEGEFQEF